MSMGLETDAFELKRMMRQEAHEKAFEIQVMAQRLYEQEKDKIVQAGLHTMNEDFDKKLQKLTQNLNIERSTKVNEARLKKMKERNDCVERVKEETRDHMLRSIVNPTNLTYRAAIKNLIIQVRYSRKSNLRIGNDQASREWTPSQEQKRRCPAS